MPIRVLCSCGKAYQVRDEHAGRRIRCRTCGGILEVPPRREDDGLVTLPVCPACQAVLEPDAERCGACGHPLAPPAQGPPELPKVPPALLTREVPAAQPAETVKFDRCTVVLVVLAGLVVAGAIGAYFAATAPDPPPEMGKPVPVPEGKAGRAKSSTSPAGRTDRPASPRPSRVGIAPAKAAPAPAPGPGGESPAKPPQAGAGEDPTGTD